MKCVVIVMMMACDDDLSLKKRFEFKFSKTPSRACFFKNSSYLNCCVRVLVDIKFVIEGLPQYIGFYVKLRTLQRPVSLVNSFFCSGYVGN